MIIIKGQGDNPKGDDELAKKYATFNRSPNENEDDILVDGSLFKRSIKEEIGKIQIDNFPSEVQHTKSPILEDPNTLWDIINSGRVKSSKTYDHPNFESDEVIKIGVSQNEKYLYLLTNFEGLMIVENKEDQQTPESLTNQEIYNFHLIEEETCIAFGTTRFSVLVFKRKQLVNVLHSEEESPACPFITELTKYNPKDMNQFLWLEGRSGVRTLTYDKTEFSVEQGELIKLWDSEKLGTEFIIVAVEEAQDLNLILGLAFTATASDAYIQLYDKHTNSLKSISTKETDWLAGKIVISVLYIDGSSSFVCAGYEEDSKGESTAFLSTFTVVSEAFGSPQIKPGAFSRYSSYERFVNLKGLRNNRFLVCAHWDVLVLTLDEERLRQLYVFQDLHEELILDVVYFGGSLYSVSKEPERLYKKISFE